MEMTITEKETMYGKVESLCKKLANNYALKCSESFEVMLSEVHVAFLKACDTYEESYGTKFTTHLVWQVRSHMGAFIKKQKIRNMDSLDVTKEETIPSPTNHSFGDSIHDLFKEGSDLCKVVVTALIETPELLGITHSDSPYEMKVKLKSKMREEYKMKERDFSKLFKEIRTLLYN